jgi:hypothetical protein
MMSSEIERKAIEAERIMNEPLLIETLKEMEAAIINKMLDPKATAPDLHEATVFIRTLRALPAAFKAHIAAAKQTARPRHVLA